MKDRKDLVRTWLANGDVDLKVAENEFGDDTSIYFVVCFHAQQAAEKYLKAYMIHLDIHPRHIHEIGELIESISAEDPGIKSIQQDADLLTSYAVEIRYPDTAYHPSRDETGQAIAITKVIRDYIKNLINP